MSSIPTHPDEQARLAALYSYHILDTLEEKDFDDLTTLAAAICQVPFALISLVDKNRQWFKSHKGLTVSETPIEQSFCAHAIVSTDDITIVEDAHEDTRFKENPLVTGNLNVTFYAGVPLINEDGLPLGTLCVIDQHKKELTQEQKDALKTLARQVMDKLELKKKVREMQMANEVLRRSERTIHQLNEELSVSNARTKTLIEQAPVSIIVFRGNDLIVEAVNASMLQLLDKSADILGKPLLQAIPELEGQPPFMLLNSVYQTGKSVYGHDTPVVLNRNGVQETGYYNFSYTPLIEDGEIVGIIDTAVEVTDQVMARKELEKANDKMDMALKSGQLGVWSLDLSNEIITLSERSRSIFGIETDTDLTLSASLDMISEEYRSVVDKCFKEAMETKAAFDVEYIIYPLNGGAQRWLRSNGRAYYDAFEKPLYVTGTIFDITEQKQDEQRKNDFIGMVSHELKTPLTSMTGYVQLMLAKARKNEDLVTTNMLERTNTQVKKMTTMINGFLNMSRLEAGKIHLDIVAFDIDNLVEEIVEESALIFPGHKIHFSACKSSFLHADRDKIGQVISNFISNAVKYAYDSKKINVACSEKDDQVTISVTDFGEGIKQEDQEKLFERYYRVENKQKSTIAGFGIGLYLCAEIIQRHNGKIWVESEPGKGSTFYFSLPVQTSLIQ